MCVVPGNSRLLTASRQMSNTAIYGGILGEDTCYLGACAPQIDWDMCMFTWVILLFLPSPVIDVATNDN